MKVDRKGCTRIVFVFKSVVVKIPNFTCQWSHFLKGLIGNISEGQTWKWNSGSFEKGKSYLLCPVIWYSWGGWVLIMRKADVLDWEDDFNRNHWITAGFGGDDKPHNYGRLNGIIVKIDYADLDKYWGEDFKPGKEINYTKL